MDVDVDVEEATVVVIVVGRVVETVVVVVVMLHSSKDGFLGPTMISQSL